MAGKLKLLLKGSAFRVMQTCVSIAVGLIMMPFLINSLGTELYGLWVVVMSVAGTYYLLDLGFSQAVTRYVTKYIHQNRVADANRIINTALVIYACLGLVVLAISILIALIATENLMEGSENISLVQVLLLLSGLQLAIEFPSKAYPGVISAYLRFDSIAKVRMAKTILDACLIYLFISNGYGLIAMALIGFTTSLITTYIYVKLSNNLFIDIEYSRRHISPSVVKKVFNFSKWLFVFDVNMVFRERMDIWFVAFYLNSAILTTYYVAVRLIEYAMFFLTQATGITGPVFTELYAKKKWTNLKNSLERFVQINLWLGSVVLFGFFMCGQAFIDLWIGDEIKLNQTFLCLMILSAGRIAAYVAAPFQSVMITYNKHRFGAYLSLLETIVSAALCVLLIPPYGLVGAAAAVALPACAGRLLVLPLFVNYEVLQYLNVKFMVRVVAFISLTLISQTAVYYSLLGVSANWQKLLVGGALVVLVQAALIPILFKRADISVFIHEVVGKIKPYRYKRI